MSSYPRIILSQKIKLAMGLVLFLSVVAIPTMASDRFVDHGNGTVTDTKTGLMWADKDNGSQVTWQEAEEYCMNYRGGSYTNWRIPTIDELVGLYDSCNPKNLACFPSKNIYITNLIHLSCCCVWSSNTRSFGAASFSFVFGKQFWLHQSYNFFNRALPVRYADR